MGYGVEFGKALIDRLGTEPRHRSRLAVAATILLSVALILGSAGAAGGTNALPDPW
jgi:hypothetical protein